VVALAAVVFVAVFRNKPVFRISQLQMMVVLSVGYAVFALSLLLQHVGYLKYLPGICQAYFVLFFMSGFAVFTVLTLKTWRAWRLLKSTQTLRRIVISNKLLWKWILGVESIVAILLIAWFTDYPLQVNPCENVGAECTAAAEFGGEGGTAFEIALSVLLVLAFLAASIMAFIARRVPSVASETKGIIFTSFAFFFGQFVIVTLVYRESNLDNTVKSWIVSLYFLIVTLVSLYLLVFNKAHFFNLSQDDVRAAFLSSSVKTRRGYETGATSREPSPKRRSSNQSMDVENEKVNVV